MSNKKPVVIPETEWEWFGDAGHFVCSQWCRFHLCTKVGEWLVSTVGAYVHPRHGRGSEQQEAAWLKTNWPGEDIGAGRKFETMVFRAGERCAGEECNCGMPEIDGGDVDFRGYNTTHEAAVGHLALCRQYAAEAARKEASHD